MWNAFQMSLGAKDEIFSEAETDSGDEVDGIVRMNTNQKLLASSGGGVGIKLKSRTKEE